MSSSVQQHSTADAALTFVTTMYYRDDLSPDLTPIFYPTSPSKVADPDKGAALFAELYSQSPQITIICDFVNFILDSTANKPEDVDSLMKAAHLTYFNESLPTCYWASHKPKSTFREIFNIDFHDKICGHLTTPDTSDRAEFLNASFIAGRARGLNLMDGPNITGAVGEGLRLPNEMTENRTGEIAEIWALGACLQLLGSGSDLLTKDDGKRFPVEVVIKALEGIEMSAQDKPLVDVNPQISSYFYFFYKSDSASQLTIRHLQSTPLIDLTSREIVQSARSAGWDSLWTSTGAPEV